MQRTIFHFSREGEQRGFWQMGTGHLPNASFAITFQEGEEGGRAYLYN